MLLNYTTENLKKVVDLFQQQKIACLTINKDDEAMCYFLISDFEEDEAQKRILKLQADSLSTQLTILNILNKLYTNLLANNPPTQLYLHYDITTERPIISYRYAWGDEIETDYGKKKLLEDTVQVLLEQVTLVGIGNKEIPDIYTKEKDGRKKPKPIPITVAEALLLIKNMVS